MTAPIRIGAWATRAERPLLLAAAEQLSEALTDPGEPVYPVTIRFLAGDEAAPPPIILASLIGEVAATEPIAAVAARLGRRFAAAGDARPFLCTLLRFVGDRAERRETIPRIRALNLMAVDLSHDHGVVIVDVDRILALFGAEPLRTDYRLLGPAPAEMAAHVIVSSLLLHGLDDMVPAERLERAIARHGDVHAIAAIVDRRLAAKAGRRG